MRSLPPLSSAPHLCASPTATTARPTTRRPVRPPRRSAVQPGDHLSDRCATEGDVPLAERVAITVSNSAAPGRGRPPHLAVRRRWWSLRLAPPHGAPFACLRHLVACRPAVRYRRGSSARGPWRSEEPRVPPGEPVLPRSRVSVVGSPCVSPRPCILDADRPATLRLHVRLPGPSCSLLACTFAFACRAASLSTPEAGRRPDGRRGGTPPPSSVHSPSGRGACEVPASGGLANPARTWTMVAPLIPSAASTAKSSKGPERAATTRRPSSATQHPW